MAQIGLLDYLQKIDSLLEENRLEEVIAHCRHILEQHPRHVDSYRLLGKALLEQQKYDEAREIFQRILGADPEDFISHTGLAILYKDTGKVPEAIWHMERALEMDPYNAAIQVELKRLYGHRDGQEPERVALTRGALARLYFRGELYQQAAAELRAILAEEPDRIDMRTLLAETLWRADQRVDAVEVCLDVLETLPDCVKANAVLAEVWLATGRVDEVQEYLQRLQALTLVDSTSLDDESAIGQIFAQDGQTTLPERVLVDELDYLPIAAQSLDADADWIQEVGIDGVQEGGAQLDWLQEMGEIESPFGVGDAGEEVLDWLREVAAGEDDGDVVGNEVDEAPIVAEEQTMAPAEHVDDPLGWFDEQTDSVQESFQDVPDWLSEITASAEADMWDSAVSDEEQDLETDADMSPDMPDWMRELTGEETVPEVEKAADSSFMADAEHPEIPDWLDSPSEPANAAPEEQPGEVSTSLEESSNQVEEGVPEWLEELPDLEEDFSKGEQAARSNEEVSDSQGGEDPGVFFLTM